MVEGGLSEVPGTPTALSPAATLPAGPSAVAIVCADQCVSQRVWLEGSNRVPGPESLLDGHLYVIVVTGIRELADPSWNGQGAPAGSAIALTDT